jgi:uncharacterized membrane protein
MRQLIAVLVFVSAGALGARAQSAVELFHIVDAFDESDAVAVNGKGTVVGTAFENGERLVFRWRFDGSVRIILRNAFATDINDRGQIVGTRVCVNGSCPQYGFVWTPATGERNLGSFRPNAINETGDMAGMCLTTVRRPCALVGGTRYVLSSADGIATDINENGVVSGHLFATAERGARPFVWSRATGRRALDASSYDHGLAEAINDYGQVVGALRNDAVDEVPPTVAVRWRSIGRITAVYPDNTWAHAVENHGWVVGSCCWPPDEANLAYPILWRSGRITRLPLGAESGGWAVDINESGVIVGSVTNDGETSRAAIWRLVQ